MVAEAAQWYGHEGVRDRTFTEDHARDSYENLMFGLCRFYELTGVWVWVNRSGRRDKRPGASAGRGLLCGALCAGPYPTPPCVLL